MSSKPLAPGSGRIAVPRAGRVGRVPLPLVLQALAEDRDTGILTMQGDGDIVAVSFLEGTVVAADALNQTVEEGLGQVLVARGLIGQALFDQLAREHQGGRDGTLADVLVARGLISRGQLLDCLRQQTVEQLFAILEWQSGEFKFYGGDEVSYEEGMSPIAVDELLVESIVAAGDAVPRVEEVYRSRTPSQSLRIVGQDLSEQAGGIWLALEEHALWQQTDGERPARAVMPAMRPRRLQFALHRLAGLGLIEPVAAVPDPALEKTGMATIFYPPDPTLLEDTAVSKGASALDRRALAPWVARAVAILATLALAFAASRRPSVLIVPFPWQEAHRAGLENQLRQSRMDGVEGAARTYFLMEQRFPGSLVDLVDAGLLGARDLRDPIGAPMGYTTEDDSSYRISVAAGGDVVERHVEVAADDFLLGDISGGDKDESTAPLYLID